MIHWKGLRHLVNYVASTRDLKLRLYPSKDAKPLKTICDASWGGGRGNRKIIVRSNDFVPELSRALDFEEAAGGIFYVPC